MVESIVRCLPVVALALALTGCSNPMWHRQTSMSPATPEAPAPVQSQGPANQTERELPPDPAPALFIPGPVKTPAASTNNVPATPVSLPREPALSVVPTVSAAAPTPAVTPLRNLQKKASERYAGMDSYTMRLKRREFYNGEAHPEELILCKIRREPWSVYLKWLGPEGKGREVIYVKGRYEDKIHTLLAAWDIPLMPAGKRFAVAPDSFLVRSKSRYPITDAGIGPLVERFAKLVDATELGDASHGTLKHLGQLKRPEFDTTVEGALQTIPPNGDPLLPRGGQRLWFFDPANNLPVLVIAHDETGREVEYYCHDRFQFPVQLDNDDFNPDRLWSGAP